MFMQQVGLLLQSPAVEKWLPGVLTVVVVAVRKFKASFETCSKFRQLEVTWALVVPLLLLWQMDASSLGAIQSVVEIAVPSKTRSTGSEIL